MKLLFVDACMRGKHSRTLALCEEFLEACRQARPGLVVERACLPQLLPAPMTGPEVAQRDERVAEGALGGPEFALARQFAEADLILFGAPYWDYSFPAALKAYIEHVSVCGITFEYVQTGWRGLCKAQRLYYITTAGGDLGRHNHGFDYIRGVCGGLFGIPNAVCVAAEGLDIEGADQQAALAKARGQLAALAATL